MGRVCTVGAALVLSLLLGVGAQAVESYSAPTVKVDSGDLAADINSFVKSIPTPSHRSGGYDTPSQSEAMSMAQAYDAIEAGNLSQAASIVDPFNYDVVQYTDTAN